MDMLLVLSKNPYTLSAKLGKIAKNWRFRVCTKLSKMTLIQNKWKTCEIGYQL